MFKVKSINIVPRIMQQESRFQSFVDKPSNYHGAARENPVAWCKSLDRLKKGLLLGDAQVSLVASSHLRDAAGLWWDSVEDRVTTWLEFKEQFELNFASETPTGWWDELEGLGRGNQLDSLGLIHPLQDLFASLNH
jgi:hypothetical protein